MSDWLIPDWPAPARVKACVTTRAGGVSLAPFDSLNLGDHVEDSLDAVLENRRRLTDAFVIQPAWLRQVHGIKVVEADPARLRSDAVGTTLQACLYLKTADACRVVCTLAVTVWAAHAGLRGGGRLWNRFESLTLKAPMCWSGSPGHWPTGLRFGPECVKLHEATADYMPKLVPGRNPGKFMDDIYRLPAALPAGCPAVYGGVFAP